MQRGWSIQEMRRQIEMFGQFSTHNFLIAAVLNFQSTPISSFQVSG
jgi:hypothetical protein